MNVFQVYMLSIFDLAMLYLLMTKIFRYKYPGKFTYIFVVLFGALGTTLIGEVVTHPVMSVSITIMFNIAYFYLVMLRKIVKFLDYIIGSILLLIIMYSVQIVMIIVLTYSFNGFGFTFKYGLVAQSSALIALSLLTHYVNFNKLFNYINYRNVWLKSTLITSLAIYLTLSMLWDLNKGSFISSIMTIGMTLLVILLVNTFVIKGSLSDKRNREQLKIYETYLPIIDHIIDEIKVKQHDYHNQVQTIALLKEEIEGTSYNTYIDEVVKKDIWDQLILLDSKVLMAFLYSKYREAKNKGVKIKYEFKTFVLTSRYTDYELVEMIGILIDNAIEATLETSEKSISVVLEHHNQLNRCIVSNDVVEFSMSDIPKMFDFYHSSKGNGRGIGMYKLKSYLDREKGTINVFYDTKTQLLYVDICFN